MTEKSNIFFRPREQALVRVLCGGLYERTLPSCKLKEHVKAFLCIEYYRERGGRVLE